MKLKVTTLAVLMLLFQGLKGCSYPGVFSRRFNYAKLPIAFDSYRPHLIKYLSEGFNVKLDCLSEIKYTLDLFFHFSVMNLYYRGFRLKQ
jgi:hypothetical protein